MQFIIDHGCIKILPRPIYDHKEEVKKREWYVPEEQWQWTHEKQYVAGAGSRKNCKEGNHGGKQEVGIPLLHMA